MSRRLFAPVAVLIFGLPGAIAALAVWPLYPGRPVPDTVTPDAVAILIIGLLFGAGVTMFLGDRARGQ